MAPDHRRYAQRGQQAEVLEKTGDVEHQSEPPHHHEVAGGLRLQQFERAEDEQQRDAGITGKELAVLHED